MSRQLVFLLSMYKLQPHSSLIGPHSDCRPNRLQPPLYSFPSPVSLSISLLPTLLYSLSLSPTRTMCIRQGCAPKKTLPFGLFDTTTTLEFFAPFSDETVNSNRLLKSVSKKANSQYAAKISTMEENSKEKLVTTMAPGGAVHQDYFKDIEMEHSMSSGDEVDGTVLLVAFDPPYEIRYEKGKGNADHDRLTHDDMNDFMTHITSLKKKRVRGKVILSSVQFSHCYKALTAPEEDAPFREKDSCNVWETRTPVFRENLIVLLYTQAPRLYNKDALRTSLSHTFQTECDVHFWLHGLPLCKSMDRVDYRAANSVARLSAVDELGHKIPPLSLNEAVYVPVSADGTGTHRRSMVHPERENVQVMRSIICKFPNHGDTVLDTFARTFSTAKTCFLSPKHRTFIGRDSSRYFLDVILPYVVNTFSLQLLSQESDIECKYQAQNDAKVFIDAIS